MANDTTKSPWILDTAGVVTTDLIRVAKVRWVAEGAAAGNNVRLTNTADRTFWESTATGVNFEDESDTFLGLDGNVQGLKVAVIEAGKLYVHLA